MPVPEPSRLLGRLFSLGFPLLLISGLSYKGMGPRESQLWTGPPAAWMGRVWSRGVCLEVTSPEGAVLLGLGVTLTIRYITYFNVRMRVVKC